MARHLITSALPYVNGTKHLGNLVGSLLPADALARWLRQEGHEVLFVCGTDEHGAAPELAAAAAGVPVARWCREVHARQRSHYEAFGLSLDHFGRTTSPTHRRRVHQLYADLDEAGWIGRGRLRLPYSPTDGRTLPDRYVRGDCPHCGADARGDECPGCGRLLDPTDLVAPRSALSGATDLRWVDRAHRFLRLSALAEPLSRWVESRAGTWPALSTAVARAWLQRGLQDRCITRDLSWGIEVADLPETVFYCWFDAPVAYLSLVEEATGDLEAWWGLDADVTITQFLGKDNLPFHTVLFPAALLGQGRWRLPDRVVGLHWLQHYGQRFSTSAHRGVFLDDALQILPADVWRWVLLARAPESSDADLTWEELVRVHDKDLAGGLGNLVHRVLILAARDGAEQPAGRVATGADQELVGAVEAALEQLQAAFAVPSFRSVVGACRTLVSLGHRYLADQAPWALRRTDPARAGEVLGNLFALLRCIAVATRPLVPTTSARILDALSVPEGERRQPVAWHGRLAAAPGRPFAVPPPLFPRLDRRALPAGGEVDRALQDAGEEVS